MGAVLYQLLLDWSGRPRRVMVGIGLAFIVAGLAVASMAWVPIWPLIWIPPLAIGVGVSTAFVCLMHRRRRTCWLPAVLLGWRWRPRWLASAPIPLGWAAVTVGTAVWFGMSVLSRRPQFDVGPMMIGVALGACVLGPIVAALQSLATAVLAIMGWGRPHRAIAALLIPLVTAAVMVTAGGYFARPAHRFVQVAGLELPEAAWLRKVTTEPVAGVGRSLTYDVSTNDWKANDRLELWARSHESIDLVTSTSSGGRYDLTIRLRSRLP